MIGIHGGRVSETAVESRVGPIMVYQVRLMRLVLLLLLAAAVTLGGWLNEERITARTNAADRTSPNNARCLAVDPAGNVHAVWYGDVGGMRQIWYSRREAATGEWSPDTAVTAGVRDAVFPSVSADPAGNVHIIWQANTTIPAICYRMRAAAGGWGAVETIWRGSGAASPSIASAGTSVVQAVWIATYPAQRQNVLFAVRDSTGWRTPSVLSEDNGSAYSNPCIAAASDTHAAVVWNRVSVPRLVCARLLVNHQAQPLETLSIGGGLASISAGRGDIYRVVWSKSGGTADSLRVRTWARGGWQAVVPVECAGSQARPAAVADDAAGRPNLSWCAPGQTAVLQVHHAVADSAGTQWQSAQRLTEASIGRENPSVACGPDGSVQVIWTDQRHSSSNTDVYFRRWEFVRDVAVLGFAALPDTVDSGGAVLPTVAVANLGDTVERRVPVWLCGPGVSADTVLDTIARGDTVVVRFDSLVCRVRGWNAVVCSTRIEGDRRRGNDAAHDSFFVAVRDAAVDSIVAPRGQVAEDSVAPVVLLANRGNLAARCTCVVSIVRDSAVMYEAGAAVGIGPDSSARVTLPHWRTAPGEYALRASVRLAGDMVRANDTLSARFSVPRRDVGVAGIIAPVGQFDSGAVVEPRVVVFNAGAAEESFAALLWIGPGWLDSARVERLGPGESLAVRFREWRALERGASEVRCSLVVRPDHEPGNDTAAGVVFVRVIDAAARSIELPPEEVGFGTLSPLVRVQNCGTQADSVHCRFEIRAGDSLAYADLVVAGLPAGVDSTVEFGAWETHGGWYRAVLRVSAGGDMRPENDSVTAVFRVHPIDAAAREIVAPRGVIGAGLVAPAVRIANLGDETEDIRLRLCIGAGGGTGYDESTLVTVEPGRETTAMLPAWHASCGEYSVFARVALRGDITPGNDRLVGSVVVESVGSQRWTRLADIPAGPRGLPVLGGGALAGAGGRVYALKGGSGELWAYSPPESAWTARAALGESCRTGGGAALTWDGERWLYAIRGRQSDDLWRFDVAGDSWQACPSLPPHVRRFGRGAALACWRGDTLKLFALPGAGSLEFLCYLPGVRRWHARRPLPVGPTGRRPRRGSCLVSVGNRLFCLKGGTGEFYEYFPRRDSWVERSGMPRISRAGRTRSGGDGAAAGWDGGDLIYFTKGRGLEFWRYRISADTWEQLEDVPRSVPRRTCRRGTGLSVVGGSVYLLRGNATREFWRYDPNANNTGTLAVLPSARHEPSRVGLRRGPLAPSGSDAAGWRWYDAAGRRVLPGRRDGVLFAVGPDGAVKLVQVRPPAGR